MAIITEAITAANSTVSQGFLSIPDVELLDAPLGVSVWWDEKARIMPWKESYNDNGKVTLSNQPRPIIAVVGIKKEVAISGGQECLIRSATAAVGKPYALKKYRWMIGCGDHRPAPEIQLFDNKYIQPKESK